MNCCKFQKLMTKPILKESVAKSKLRNKMSKHKMIFYVNENNISKAMFFNILLVLTSRKYSEDCSSLSTELLSSVNKNSTILYNYLMLQFKDETRRATFMSKMRDNGASKIISVKC